MAVATNPMFPAHAVRNGWPGPTSRRMSLPFEIVASFETFHFSKPQPAFFAELLARMGWPAGPVALVGDDLERDVAAGRRLGLPVYWIAQADGCWPRMARMDLPPAEIDRLLPWIDSAPAEALRPDLSQPDGPAGDPVFHPGCAGWPVP